MKAKKIQVGCFFFLVMFLMGGSYVSVAGHKIKLPTFIKLGLKRHYQNWHLVTNKMETGKICPSLLTGDFDGNGQTDYAIYLVTNKPPITKQQRFVLYLKKGARYYRRTLSQQPVDQMTCPCLYKKGLRDYRYDTHQYFRYRHDTVGWVMGMGGVSYIYEKRRFNEVATVD